MGIYKVILWIPVKFGQAFDSHSSGIVETTVIARRLMAQQIYSVRAPQPIEQAEQSTA